MANQKKEPGAIAAGLIGAAVGAAVAAGSIALADEKNRKKVEKVIENFKGQGNKLMDLIQKESQAVRDLTGGGKTNTKAKTGKKSGGKKSKKA
jgi:hypothetical protein